MSEFVVCGNEQYSNPNMDVHIPQALKKIRIISAKEEFENYLKNLNAGSQPGLSALSVSGPVERVSSVSDEKIDCVAEFLSSSLGSADAMLYYKLLDLPSTVSKVIYGKTSFESKTQAVVRYYFKNLAGTMEALYEALSQNDKELLKKHMDA